MERVWISKLKEIFDKKGLTLLEVLVVLVILSILVVIAIPSISSSIDKANTEVCHTNRIELERSYEMYLALEELTHNELLFKVHTNEFGEIICPEDGIITYVDEQVNCNIHTESEHEEDGKEEVPFL